MTDNETLETAVCPQCQSSEVVPCHADGTFGLPECDMWVCEECCHQWGHR